MQRGNEMLRSPSVVGSVRARLNHSSPTRPHTNPPPLPMKLAAWRLDVLLPIIFSHLQPYKLKSEAIRDEELANVRANYHKRRGDIEEIINSIVARNMKREMDIFSEIPRIWTPPEDIDISFDDPYWFSIDNNLSKIVEEQTDHESVNSNDLLSKDHIIAITAHFDNQEAQIRERQQILYNEQKLISMKEAKLQERERHIDALHNLQQEERKELELQQRQMAEQKIKQDKKETELRQLSLRNETEHEMRKQEVQSQENEILQKYEKIEYREQAVWEREYGVKAREDNVALKYREVKEFQEELRFREEQLLQQKEGAQLLAKQAEKKYRDAEEILLENIPLAEAKIKESVQKLQQIEERESLLMKNVQNCSQSLLEKSKEIMQKENELKKRENELKRKENKLEQKESGFKKQEEDFVKGKIEMEKHYANIKQEQSSIQQGIASLEASKVSWYMKCKEKNLSIHNQQEDLLKTSDALMKRNIQLK
ncbi:hypothetical protein C8R42DRAFT_728588 [Lentinula raphanica]|nr:hypothetical protein C8R42DRAFT_728588 [Lentinula raphanica]